MVNNRVDAFSRRSSTGTVANCYRLVHTLVQVMIKYIGSKMECRVFGSVRLETIGSKTVGRAVEEEAKQLVSSRQLGKGTLRTCM